jgi:hypothetical protein
VATPLQPPLTLCASMFGFVARFGSIFLQIIAHFFHIFLQMMAILAIKKKIRKKKNPTGAIIIVWLKIGYLQNKYTYYYIFFQGEVYKI